VTGRGPLLLDRRRFLQGLVAAGALTPAACARGNGRTGSAGGPTPPPGGPALVLPGDPAVLAAEARRARPGGRVVGLDLAARPAEVDLGGAVVRTWTYGGTVPGPLLRARAGDTVKVRLANELPADTVIHWHGLHLRNDMDGVHHVTQDPVGPGQTFTYRFAVAQPGTYWFHSHHGLQADRGLYAPLIVDDPDDRGGYDVEHVVVLDDWIDGLGGTPEDVFAQLHAADPPEWPGAPASLVGRFRSPLLGGDAGSVAHRGHLVNGRLPADAPTLDAPPGGRVRLRVINAGAETAYRLAVAGHRLTVTHADGFPVEPVEVDTVLIGMGERYDFVVTVRSGAWPLVASAEGKGAAARALLRTTDTTPATSPAPAPGDDAGRPELDGRCLAYDDLRALPAVRLDARPADAVHEATLTGRAARFHWGINGDAYPDNGPIDVREGQRVRLAVRNTTNMWHPMHLHGHTFRLGGRPDGPRKDTVVVRPGEAVALDTSCDNPGQWMLHCHNGYHLEAGMAVAVRYVR
jgi:FtsP/CotA-like multicopper oxidase with cupredoxin domain